MKGSAPPFRRQHGRIRRGGAIILSERGEAVAVSKANMEAAARYNKANVRRVTVIFSPLDRDIQRYLESKESMGGYLKKLLREDWERNGCPEF